MNNIYYISIREPEMTRTFPICGCEAAFNAYKASAEWVEAIGIEAIVDMMDGYTGEILATTYEED